MTGLLARRSNIARVAPDEPLGHEECEAQYQIPMEIGEEIPASPSGDAFMQIGSGVAHPREMAAQEQMDCKQQNNGQPHTMG